MRDRKVHSLIPSRCTTKQLWASCSHLFACVDASVYCRLVTFRLRFDSHCRSFASNLEQVANLLCAQANSTSYPPRDEKWVVANGLRGESLVWLIRAMVCLLAANCRSNICSFTWAMDGPIVQSQCQSTATSEIVRALPATSPSHVRSAIASTGFTFLPLPSPAL